MSKTRIKFFYGKFHPATQKLIKGLIYDVLDQVDRQKDIRENLLLLNRLTGHRYKESDFRTYQSWTSREELMQKAF